MCCAQSNDRIALVRLYERRRYCVRVRQCSCRSTDTNRRCRPMRRWPRRPVQRPPRAGAAARTCVCLCVCLLGRRLFSAACVYPVLYRDDAKYPQNAQKNCPAIRIESVRVLSFANSRARFTATPHSPAGQRCHLIKNTHKNKSTQSAERSRLGPCTMETEHREHGRTRGAAAASSEPGARGISAVDHAWYVTCVSTARV